MFLNVTQTRDKRRRIKSMGGAFANAVAHADHLKMHPDQLSIKLGHLNDIDTMSPKFKQFKKTHGKPFKRQPLRSK
jgi:hypothetical protein